MKPETTAPEAFWSRPFGRIKQWDESKATEARANSTKSDSGRRRRAYKRPKLEVNVTFNCDWLFTLFTFAPSKFRLFFASGICPGSLASCFTRNRPSFVKSCVISFCYSVQSSLVAKQTITFGAANGGSITFSILSRQIDFSWTQINLWISRERFPTTFIFLSLETFALHRKKSLRHGNLFRCFSSTHFKQMPVLNLSLVLTSLSLHRAWTWVSYSISEFYWPTTRQKLWRQGNIFSVWQFFWAGETRNLSQKTRMLSQAIQRQDLGEGG